MTTSRAAPLPPRPSTAADGPGAVSSSLQSALRTSAGARGAHVFLHVNPRDGFGSCAGAQGAARRSRRRVERCAGAAS